MRRRIGRLYAECCPLAMVNRTARLLRRIGACSVVGVSNKWIGPATGRQANFRRRREGVGCTAASPIWWTRAARTECFELGVQRPAEVSKNNAANCQWPVSRRPMVSQLPSFSHLSAGRLYIDSILQTTCVVWMPLSYRISCGDAWTASQKYAHYCRGCWHKI